MRRREDYATFSLFEIPGGEWLVIEPIALPAPNVQLARERVLKRLWP